MCEVTVYTCCFDDKYQSLPAAGGLVYDVRGEETVADIVEHVLSGVEFMERHTNMVPYITDHVLPLVDTVLQLFSHISPDNPMNPVDYTSVF